jgi:hypothetical protein
MHDQTNKKIQKDEIMMNIGGKVIGRVTKIKYLRVFLDDALKLDEHVDYMCKKMAS